MRLGLCASTGLGILLLAALAAAPGPSPAGKPLVLTDPAAGIAGLEASDCREVRVEPGEAGLAFTVTLGAPIASGLFTCVHVFLDADGNAETGIGGSELWFRAAVGSRFRPNDYVPATPGVPAPLTLARLSYSLVADVEDVIEGKASKHWLNHPMKAVPSIDGATLGFAIPEKVLARVADRYGAEAGFRVQVETSCGDQPLFVEYRAADDGLPIRVDGDARDWSGEPSAEDAGGELYAPLRFLDLRRLRVDHEAQRLFVCVDTDAPGFADPPPVSADVSLYQCIVLLAEPLDSAYDSPKRVTIFRGRPSPPAAEDEWAMKDETVEVAISRSGFDGRVRVLAWSEAVHRDSVPDRGNALLSGRK